MTINNKKHRKRSFLSALLLAFSPLVFILIGFLSVFNAPFDYNKTLIKNISNNVAENNAQFILSFNDNNGNGLKEWDNYSKIMNRDYYGNATFFRLSKDSFELVTDDDQKTSSLFSDILQCDIQNNEGHNYSGLKIDASMVDFTEDSVFISDKFASQMNLSIGDNVSFTFLDEVISLSVLGIYNHEENTRYVNNCYYEIEEPVCFVSRKVFNKISGDHFYSYAYLNNNKTLIDSLYVEISPLLSINKLQLTINDKFSTNNFMINGKTAKQFQNDLLQQHQTSHTYFYLYIVFAVAIFILILIINWIVYGKVLLSNNNILTHAIGFLFVYSLSVVAISIAAAFLLSSYCSTFAVSGYTAYRSLKTPLILISSFTIVFLVMLVIRTCSRWKQRKNEIAAARQEKIKEMKKQNSKVVFVTGGLSRGGAEKVIVELANYYASIGREVDIVILLDNIVNWDINEKINIINFTGNTKSRIRRIRYWIKNLKEYFGENKNTTIVSFLVRVNILVLLSVKRKNHHIIISERNDPRFDGRGIIVKSFVNSLYPKADCIVFQTKECQDLFCNDIKEKGIVIPNPITIKEYASFENYKKHVFVSAGRLTGQKNQITMIKAMAIVCKKYPDAILEIYGNGDLADKLTKAISDLGLQNNVYIFPNTKEINDKILHSQAYICSSLYEGMSNSLMEASFAGIPCITTRCLGTDFIKEPDNGYFIEFFSPKDLAEKILRFLADENLYAELRKRSISIAKSIEHKDVYLRWKECIDNE